MTPSRRWPWFASLILLAWMPPASGNDRPQVYIDTDLAAEVDDSFAVYRALIAPEFQVVGLSTIGWEGPRDFASNTRASQKMSEEMLDLLGLRERIAHPIGALQPMPAAATPVDSPAARDLIATAHAMPAGQKLQVFVLGCYTNVASALLLDPSITDKLTVHVMGFRFDNERLTPNESNTMGDLHAAAHLLKSGVELKAMVNSTLRYFQWSKVDVDAHFKGQGGVRDYLVERWESYSPDDAQRTLWDIAVFEAVLRPHLATLTEIEHEGRQLQVWTQVDIPAMKADYWEAAATLTPGFSQPQSTRSSASSSQTAAKPRVFIDTDTANEVDDPFAIYRALVAPEFEVVGLSSAGWGQPAVYGANTRTSQKMNEELLALLQLTDRLPHPIGALQPLPSPSTPVDSPAAQAIIAAAKATPDGQKLQVFVLGCYTNIASAILLEPGIKDKLSVHLMGFNYHDGKLHPTEFNTLGDLHAAACLLESGVELKVMVNTSMQQFHWKKSDVLAHFKGKGGVPDYLVNRWGTFCPNDPQRILWDIAVFEAVLRPHLATLTEIDQAGSRISVWTQIDVPGMQADYWEATAAAAQR